MQTGRLHASCAAGPPGGRHCEGPFDNRAPTRLRGHWLDADRRAGRTDQVVMAPQGRRWRCFAMGPFALVAGDLS
jgi:hypothetical protein